MTRPRLLITRRLGDAILNAARAGFELTVWPEDEPIGIPTGSCCPTA